jgi:prevent-host-death family protein
MKEVSVTELRRNLRAFLARVRRGDRLRVTSRGRPVAEIGPPVADADRAADARARLYASVLRYYHPSEPTFAPEEWEMNR